MSVRGDLAVAIAAALATPYPKVQVYATPEDVTQVPAVVLAPDDPWAAPATMGGGTGGPGVWAWGYLVQLVVHRADPRSALDTLEGLLFAVTEGAGTLGARVGALSAPKQVELANVQVLISELEVELLTSRKG